MANIMEESSESTLTKALGNIDLNSAKGNIKKYCNHQNC